MSLRLVKLNLQRLWESFANNLLDLINLKRTLLNNIMNYNYEFINLVHSENQDDFETGKEEDNLNKFSK